MTEALMKKKDMKTIIKSMYALHKISNTQRAGKGVYFSTHYFRRKMLTI